MAIRKLWVELSDGEKERIKRGQIKLAVDSQGRVIATSALSRGVGRSPGQAIDVMRGRA